MSARWSRRRGEEGAIAVMTVILSTVLFGAAAIAIDISMLAMERQKLHDAVDAAAHAGAFTLPGDGAAAVQAARNMAQANDSDLVGILTNGDAADDPDIRLWCVVASTGAAMGVRTDQIPSTCNPGPRPYTTARYPDLRCNTRICKIPCEVGLTTCNTVEVAARKDVDFGFANIFERSEGTTGSVSSAACKGSCGQEAPNPMNVMFMADRTPSMSDANRELMKTAIADTLKTMTPSLHYVAFGALHKSKNHDASCATASTETGDGSIGGDWTPVEFSNTYLTSSPTPTLNPSDDLVKAVACLPKATGNFGTHLAASLKGAGRYLLGLKPNNIGRLPDRSGTPTNVVIFETDGQPDETIESHDYKDLHNAADFSAGRNGECRSGVYHTSGADIGYCTDYETNSNGTTGCEYFVRIAEELKDKGVIVITVGFGDAATAGCTVTNRPHYVARDLLPLRTSTTDPVRNYLARAASPDPVTGAPSVAEGCADATQIAAENADGDYFFCAAAGGELASIFKTAVAQVSTGVRLLKLPD